MTDAFSYNGEREAPEPVRQRQPVERRPAEPLRREANQDCEPGKGSICDWRPNKNASTAQQWFDAAKENNHKPLPLDKNCNYTVQYGDSLEGIASRRLGPQANRTAIDKEVNRIAEINKAAHPTLDCNKHYLRVGWKLKMDVCAQPAPEPPPPPPRPRVIERQPEIIYKDLPPRVIERQAPPIYRDLPPKVIYRESAPIYRDLPPQPMPPQPMPRPLAPPMRHDFGCNQGGADYCNRNIRPQFAPYGSQSYEDPNAWRYRNDRNRSFEGGQRQEYSVRDGRIPPRANDQYYVDPNQGDQRRRYRQERIEVVPELQRRQPLGQNFTQVPGDGRRDQRDQRDLRERMPAPLPVPMDQRQLRQGQTVIMNPGEQRERGRVPAMPAAQPQDAFRQPGPPGGVDRDQRLRSERPAAYVPERTAQPAAPPQPVRAQEAPAAKPHEQRPVANQGIRYKPEAVDPAEQAKR